MDAKKEFLAHFKTQSVVNTSSLTLASFCDWSRQQATRIHSEEFLRDISSVLIEICTLIKIREGQLSQHCRRMAGGLYSLSLELRDAIKEWEHAIGEQKIKKRQKQAGKAQDELLNGLKKFDELCPWVEFKDWLQPESTQAVAGGKSKKQIEDFKGKIDFAIITIKHEEFEAVLKRFPGEHFVVGERYYSVCRTDARDHKSYLVAVARCTFQGTGEAQNVARDIIEDLDPQWILVVGIAGGIPSHEFTLGDVVLSTRINDFTVKAVIEGKPDEYAISAGVGKKEVTNLVTFLPAMKTYLKGWNGPKSIGSKRPSVELRDDFMKLYGDESWQTEVREAIKHHFSPLDSQRRPLFISGPIISTDSLIKNTRIIKVWQQVARDTLAVDMESAGIYRAARSGKKEYPFLAIRGISDIVGLKRHPDWTEYACHSSAAFALAFVKAGFIDSKSSLQTS